MKKVQPEEGKSADIVSENIERLKELFPDAFSEGGVDFEVLRQLLGDAKVLDEGEEKYGLVWHGKKKARQIALTPSTGTLLPCPEESVDWDTTQNLFIEGDNLEVLKLLQKSYANKVKMIYIDPPYNTGKEFIYPDKFQENLDTYLKYTGQVDDEGIKFSSNMETTGRKHTNWLSMMMPRLKLARDLLSKDGTIFISIDDNEQAHLKTLCDEVFGPENFIATIIWHKMDSPKNSAKYLSEDHDYVLLYAKNAEVWRPNLLPRSEKMVERYKNPDSDPRGPWLLGDLAARNYYSKGVYSIETPSGKVIPGPPAGSFWRISEEKFKEYDKDNRIWWGESGGNRPGIKKFLSEVRDGVVPQTYWSWKDVGSTRNAKQDLSRLLQASSGEELFVTPKPIGLIMRMLQIATSNDSNDLVMDFFAGSCSTLEAVYKKNVEDDGNRRCIVVQLPEVIGASSTVSEMGKRRAKFVIEELKKEIQVSLDLGFKVFKLNSSNIKAWNLDRTDLEESLLSHQDHLLDGRSEDDVLYELLLKRGVDLSVPIKSREIAGKTIFSIGYGVLFACLDESINKSQVEEIGQAIVEWHRELAPSSDTYVFFRDSAFSDDVSKTNMAAILEQNGINHVRSL